MNKQAYLKVGWVILGGWLVFTLSHPLVHAQGIPSVPPSGNTVTIIENGSDVTDTWLPEPGVSVQILVNGAPPGSIALVPGPVFPDNGTNPYLTPPTTSAYFGQCTNFDNPVLPNNAVDFDLAGNVLTPTDCGGQAVVDVGGDIFILPQDSDLDGVPDIYEIAMCQTPTCQDAEADVENPPVFDAAVPTILQGDGIACFDEYRGFIVSGVHTRTDCRQKDLFVHLVNPQCGADSFLGGGTTTYPTDGISLFGPVGTLVSENHLHLLGFTPGANNGTTNEWANT